MVYTLLTKCVNSHLCVSLFCAGLVTRPKSLPECSWASTNLLLLFCLIVYTPPTGVKSHLCVSLFCAGLVTRPKSLPECSWASTNLLLLFCWIVYTSSCNVPRIQGANKAFR